MEFLRKIGKKSGWMAIELGAQQVNVAHILRSGVGKPEVMLCDSFRSSDEGVLNKLGKSLRMRHHRCTTLLNPGEYQMFPIDTGGASLPELKTAARWRIKDLLDYPAEQAVIDVFDVPLEKNSASRTQSVYAVAARSAIIQERVSQFQEAHIPLSVIDIPEMAQRNLASLFEQSGRGLALLTFDESGGLLTFTSGKEFYLSRRIETVSSQLMDTDTEKQTQHYERIGLELQRSIDHFDRQYNFVTLSRLLIAPSFNGLQAFLAANLDLPVETMDLASVMDFPKVPELREPQRQAQCLAILGAALRDEEAVQ